MAATKTWDGTQWGYALSPIPTLDQVPAPVGPVVLSGQRITGLADPVGNQDADTVSAREAAIRLWRTAVDIRTFGAKVDGTDDRAALLAAVASAAFYRLPLFIPGGVVGWTGRVTVPYSVRVLGCGSGSLTTAATVLKALSANAQLAFGQIGTGGQGGLSGGFAIDGNSLATNPLYFGRIVGATFDSIQVFNAAGTGILVQEAQNCTFRSVDAQGCTGPALTLDLGCGGNVFFRCEGNDSGGSSDYIVKITQSVADGTAAPYTINGTTYNSGSYSAGLVYTVPTQNSFKKCIFERPTAGALGVILHEAGTDNYLDDVNISAVAATAAFPLITMRTTKGTSQRLRIHSGEYAGTLAYTTLLDMGANTSFIVTGKPLAFNHAYLYKLLSNTLASDTQGWFKTNVTADTDPAGTGTKDNIVRDRRTAPFEFIRTSSGDLVSAVSISGEAGSRFRQLADGSCQWGNGADFNYAVARQDSTGSWKCINLAVGAGVGPSFGGGANGIIALGFNATAPTVAPTGAVGAFLWAHPADGTVKTMPLDGVVRSVATTDYVLAQITALINGAPGILDTLGEIAAQLQSDESATAAILATLNSEITNRTNADALLVPLTQRGAASGVATLGSDSRLTTAQAPKRASRAVTGTTTISATDDIVIAGGTTAYSVVLPSAAASTGLCFTIKRKSTGVITLTSSNGLIDDAASFPINTVNQTIVVISDGTDWQVI